MLVFGHRGASGRLPENTLTAFQGALDDGVAGVELDVAATSDNVLVVLHDDDLDRTNQGSGPVSGQSHVEILAATPAGVEPVPTLESVLALIGDRAIVDLELKQAGLEDDVLNLLTRFPDTRWFLSSFDHQALRDARTLSSDAELWPLSVDFNPDLLATAAELHARGVALLWDLVDGAVIAKCRDAGLQVAVWTVNDEAIARDLGSLGVDILITDHPAKMLAALGETTQ